MSRYVAPVFPPIPSPPPDNPLSLLSNAHLFEAQYVLQLGCGRSKSIVRERKRTYICYLQRLLQAEIDRRHLP